MLYVIPTYCPTIPPKYQSYLIIIFFVIGKKLIFGKILNSIGSVNTSYFAFIFCMQDVYNSTYNLYWLYFWISIFFILYEFFFFLKTGHINIHNKNFVSQIKILINTKIQKFSPLSNGVLVFEIGPQIAEKIWFEVRYLMFWDIGRQSFFFFSPP